MVIVYRSCVGWCLRRYQIAAEFTYTPEDTHSKYQTRSQSEIRAPCVLCVGSSGYLASFPDRLSPRLDENKNGGC